MSILQTLKPAKGSTHYRKRLGRGRGSGLGQTSGKGHKGQLARTGGKVRRGFEGGQMSIVRRLPKVGFTNGRFRHEVEIVNLTQIDKLGAEITVEVLKKARLVTGKYPVKILGNGAVTKKMVVKANRFSEKAKQAIEAAGGKVEVIQ